MCAGDRRKSVLAPVRLDSAKDGRNYNGRWTRSVDDDLFRQLVDDHQPAATWREQRDWAPLIARWGTSVVGVAHDGGYDRTISAE